jgi:hypothetical protein
MALVERRVSMKYDIEVTKHLYGDEAVITLVRVTNELVDKTYASDFLSVEIWPEADRRRVVIETPGTCRRLPWPADWPADIDYTHPHYEADLVELATRLAVDEWQRRQEGGQSEIISHNIS